MLGLPEPVQAAIRGDLRLLPAWLETISGDASDRARAWRHGASTLLWLARSDGPRPDADVGRDEAWADALVLDARVAWLELDHVALGRIGDQLAGVASSDSAARIVRAYVAALAGDASAVLLDAERLYEEASAQRSASFAIEGVILRAVSQMLSGDVAGATATARRASRMAQTEQLWLSHYFASVLLARLRRLGGRPHLAGLIAKSCIAVTSPVFGGWLRWELLFAGVVPPEPRSESYAERLATLATRALVERASVDDELVSLARSSAFHRADVDAVRTATRIDAPVDAWIDGTSAATPALLSGLAPPAWAGVSVDAAPVAIAGPSMRSRRMLGFATPAEFTRIAPHGTRPARPEALAAALTLAPDGIERADLFARVYGFPFRREIHDPSFKVARHQARKLLEGFAEIASEGSIIRSRALRPYAIVDPRCQPPFQDIVLRAIATSGRASAKEIAERLDVPLRTVQLALHEMVDDGVCVAAKEGRNVEYAVEDTTFCEVTVV